MVYATPRAARCGRDAGSALVGVLLALLVTGVAWADEAPGSARSTAQLDSRYRMNDHKLVVIEDYSLKPAFVDLKEGQLVAWISYASVPSEIVFSREVARSMICHSLVNFAIRDDQLRSAPIHTGEFASFCELKPGRYRYRVLRPEPSEEGAESPGALEGEILVGSPAGT